MYTRKNTLMFLGLTVFVAGAFEPVQAQQTIKAVVFDVGEVLFHSRQTEPKLLGILNRFILGEQLQAKKGAFYDYMLGNINAEEALDGVVEAIDRSELEIILKKRNDLNDMATKYWADPVKYTPALKHGIALLRAAKASGYKVYILSNFPKHFFEKLKKHYETDIFQYVDYSLVSYQDNIHVMKPDEKIYKLFLEGLEMATDIKPEECLFIDDKPENIKAGVACGMPGVIWKIGDKTPVFDENTFFDESKSDEYPEGMGIRPLKVSNAKVKNVFGRCLRYYLSDTDSKCKMCFPKKNVFSETIYS